MDAKPDNLSRLFDDIGTWTFVQVFVIIVATVILIQIIRYVLPRVAELLPTKLRLLVLNSLPITQLALVLGAAGLIIPIVFNVTLKNFVFVMGTLGVALGFAFKDYASSAVAGIVALFERPYRSGDWIKFGEDYGEVLSIGIRSLRLRTPDDNVVTIPHSRIWTDNISNSNDGSDTLMCVATFYLAPDQDEGLLTQLLSDVARSSAYLNYDMPVVVVSQNKPYGSVVKLRAYPFELRDQFAFVTDLSRRGRKALIENGIRLITIPEFGGQAG